jgi:hypothetical protein
MSNEEIQRAIDATHPATMHTSRSLAADQLAMMLIHKRHGKREIVNLIRWLLLDSPNAYSAVALPITDRAKEYHAWRDRLAADPTCWKFSEREDAIAFAAFIAGWWLRTGNNPDEFFNPPNDEMTCHRK